MSDSLFASASRFPDFRAERRDGSRESEDRFTMMSALAGASTALRHRPHVDFAPTSAASVSRCSSLITPTRVT